MEASDISEACAWLDYHPGVALETAGQDSAGLERLTGFERLLTDLIARFVMVPSESLDEAIIDSLRQIAEMLGCDRGSWWRVTGGEDAVVTHSWTHPEFRVMQQGDSASQLVPWLFARVTAGHPAAFGAAVDIPSAVDRISLQRFGAKSGIAVPFMANGECKAILGLTAIRAARAWTPQVTERLQFLASVIGQALLRNEAEVRLQSALAELSDLRDRLALENVQLRNEARTTRPHRPMVVAESETTKRVIEQIEAVAGTSATVLLLGETGSGKQVFAHVIHRASQCHSRPMITVNCAAIPAALIESELFGRERGAYTGAIARQIGRFEMANDSTIFLDEIGELPLEAQAKLLRVLQERVVERLGGGQPVKVNVRIIAATNRDLEKAVADRTFREDLFYRLNVFPIRIPPLRERTADIPALVWTFIEEFSVAFRKPIDSISKESLVKLQRHPWPGNVRQLRNIIERAVIVTRGSHLVVDDVPAVPESAPGRSTRLADIEAEQIRAVLEETRWRVRGPGGAAERLGLKPTTLDSRMAKLGIRRPGSI